MDQFHLNNANVYNLNDTFDSTRYYCEFRNGHSYEATDHGQTHDATIRGQTHDSTNHGHTHDATNHGQTYFAPKTGHTYIAHKLGHQCDTTIRGRIHDATKHEYTYNETNHGAAPIRALFQIRPSIETVPTSQCLNTKNKTWDTTGQVEIQTANLHVRVLQPPPSFQESWLQSNYQRSAKRNVPPSHPLQNSTHRANLTKLPVAFVVEREKRSNSGLIPSNHQMNKKFFGDETLSQSVHDVSMRYHTSPVSNETLAFEGEGSSPHALQNKLHNQTRTNFECTRSSTSSEELPKSHGQYDSPRSRTPLSTIQSNSGHLNNPQRRDQTRNFTQGTVSNCMLHHQNMALDSNGENLRQMKSGQPSCRNIAFPSGQASQSSYKLSCHTRNRLNSHSNENHHSEQVQVSCQQRQSHFQTSTPSREGYLTKPPESSDHEGLQLNQTTNRTLTHKLLTKHYTSMQTGVCNHQNMLDNNEQGVHSRNEPNIVPGNDIQGTVINYNGGAIMAQENGPEKLAELNQQQQQQQQKNVSHRCHTPTRVDKSQNGHHPQLNSESEDTYECYVCKQAFTSKSRLNIHLKTHTNIRPTCSICMKVFSTTSNLKRHSYTHSTIRPTCPVCLKSFSTVRNLKRHERLHSMKEPCRKPQSETQLENRHTCSVCMKVFSGIQNLRRHERIHERTECWCKGQVPKDRMVAHSSNCENMPTCKICDKSYRSEHILKQHIKRHENQRENPSNLTCIFCSKTFSNTHNSSRHQQVCRRNPVNIEKKTLEGRITVHCQECDKQFLTQFPCQGPQSRAEQQLFKCDLCGCSFDVLHDLIKHVTKHIVDSKETCNTCGLRNGLNEFQHESINEPGKNDDRVISFHCLVCEVRIKTKSELKIHMQYHSERVFRCSLCPKTFYNDNRLQVHMLHYTSYKQLKCLTCKIKFTQISSLARHKLIHSGRSKHTCDLCGASFIQLYALKRHTLVHLQIKPHKCEICAMQFRQIFMLKQHIVKFHAETICTEGSC